MPTTKKTAKKTTKKAAPKKRAWTNKSAPPPVPPTGDCILNLEEAAREARVTPRWLRETLAAGGISGRFVGGPTGWLTTRESLLAWARGFTPAGSTYAEAEAEIATRRGLAAVGSKHSAAEVEGAAEKLALPKVEGAVTLTEHGRRMVEGTIEMELPPEMKAALDRAVEAGVSKAVDGWVAEQAALSPIESLDELLEIIRRHPNQVDDDLANLPTFGGEDPADTAGIYSWDATRLLVGPGGAKDPQREFAIVPRDVGALAPSTTLDDEGSVEDAEPPAEEQASA